MGHLQRILEAWGSHLEKIQSQSEWMERLGRLEIELCHYKGYLLETYHQTAFNPQLQMLCGVYLKNNPRKIIQLFCSHARSEVAHDLLALNDLVALGENKNELEKSRPLSSTLALTSLPVYLIQFQNPLSYLGYLFHLEFMPTRQGPDYIEGLKNLGIPEKALSFLVEHSEVDQAHNKMMEKYVDELVHHESDVEDIIYAAKCAANLHQLMIEDSFLNGERLFKKK